MSVGHQIFKGSAFRTGTHLLTMLMAFLLLPIIVHGLGENDYAIWVIIAALAGYYGALDFGLSSAVVRFVSKHLKNPQIVQEYLATSFVIFLILSVTIILLAGIIAVSVTSIGSVESADETLRWIILITGVSTAVSFISKTSVGLITALLRYEIIASTQFFVACFRNASTYTLIVMGAGILELAFLLLICSILESLMLLYFSYKMQHPTTLIFNQFRISKAGEMFHYAKFTFVAQVADILRNHSLPLLIAALIDLKSVTAFAIAMRLWSMASAVSSSMLSIFTPVFSRYENDRSKVIEIYFNALKFANYVGVFNCIILLVVMKPFLNAWLGTDIGSTVYPLAILISISYISGVSQMPTVNLLYGLSENKKYAYSNLAQGALLIFVSYFASLYWGAIGIAVGFSIVGFVIKMFVQTSYAVKVLNLDPRDYIIKILVFFLIPCSYGLIAFVYVDLVSLFPIALQIIGLALYYITYIFCIYYFHLSSNEQKALQEIIIKKKINET